MAADEMIPLLQGKPEDKAVTDPKKLVEHQQKIRELEKTELPRYCVLCFYSKLIDTIKEKFDPETMDFHKSYSFYTFSYKGIDIAFVHPLMGAAYSGSVLEEMIALGGEYFLFLGSAGTIISEIERRELIVPTKALRDEGTSYHYQEPARYSFPTDLMLDSVKKTLDSNDIPYREGGTWTTDAPYRETKKKVKEYQKENVLTVEMEASALFSIAKHRNVDIGGLFLAADSVAEKDWRARREKKDIPKIESDKEEGLNHVLETFANLEKALEA